MVDLNQFLYLSTIIFHTNIRDLWVAWRNKINDNALKILINKIVLKNCDRVITKIYTYIHTILIKKNKIKM